MATELESRTTMAEAFYSAKKGLSASLRAAKTFIAKSDCNFDERMDFLLPDTSSLDSYPVLIA
jgi:hypothetical protein